MDSYTSTFCTFSRIRYAHLLKPSYKNYLLYPLNLLVKKLSNIYADMWQYSSNTSLDIAASGQLAETTAISATDSSTDSNTTQLSLLSSQLTSPCNMSTNQVAVTNPDKAQDSKMPPIYYQCKAARESTFKNNATELGGCATFGFEVGGESPRIGSFTVDEGARRNCFMGSRINKGTVPVNQNICLSFDPATLTCLVCDSKHTLNDSNVKCYILSDQNFVPNLAGAAGAGGCIGVIRLEDSGLDELSDLFCEIFVSGFLPPGSVVCVGSGTHLHRVGVTIYAQDWNRCVAKLTSRFREVRISPLTPLPRENLPASLANDLSMLSCWFARMYAENTLGLVDCWAKLAHAIAAQLPANESSKSLYKTVAFPVSLSPNAPLAPSRFVLTSSHCAEDVPLDGKVIDELIRTLLTALRTNLMIDCHPGVSPVRNLACQQPAKDLSDTVVLIGASNLRRCIPLFNELGYKTVDITSTGWDGSDAAIARIRTAIADASCHSNAIFVLDLLTCTSYRFKQADGGLALPIKIGANFHLLGDLEICDDKMFKAALGKILPLLGTLTGPKVILPPLPRYIVGGCCGERTHAGNSNTEEHGDVFLKKIIHLRTILRSELSGSSLQGYWVADPVSSLLDSDLLRPISAKDLGHYFRGDNVHFSPLGYTKLVAGIMSCFENAKKSDTAASVPSVSGSRQGEGRFFWRGFVSEVGATRTAFRASEYGRSAKPRHDPKRNHPYRGWKKN